MEVENNSAKPFEDRFYSTRIRENSAEIISNVKVFYNPVQEFNRDLSILVLNVYFRLRTKERNEKERANNINDNNSNINDINLNESKTLNTYVAGQKYEDGLRILEALSATGLRSIRYAKEVAGVRVIVANDLSEQAVESIRQNVKHNDVDNLIEVSHADAKTLMFLSTSQQKRFDVIDLDPYGCPNQFLDSAVQSIVDGGLLLITATDMAVLAGNAPESCYVKYSSVPLRMKCCHEMALRILLHNVDAHANRHGKYIEPLLSISADFYIRIFVRVYNSLAQCKLSMSKKSMIYQCTGCDTFTLHPLGILKPNPTQKNPNQVKYCIPTGPPVDRECTHCGNTHRLGGPIWSHPIHNKSFVQGLLEEVEKEPFLDLGTQRRIVGMLSVIEEELSDVPLYYSLDKLCSVVKLPMIPMLQFRSALLNAGYRISYSHAFKNSIKTDAPSAVLWDILRCWSINHPCKKERLENNAILRAIISKTPEHTYSFDSHPEANPQSRKFALSRFQANPTSHWGPGMKATIMIGDKLSKKIRNQNKKKNLKNKNPPDAVAGTQCKHLRVDSKQ